MFDRILTGRRALIKSVAGFAAAATLPLIARTALAQDPGASAFIQKLGDRAIKTFSDKGTKAKKKTKKKK